MTGVKHTDEEKEEAKREYQKQWRSNHADYFKEYNKKWASNNPEKVRAYKRKWARNNREKKRHLDKIYYENNREKINVYQKEWRKKKYKGYKNYYEYYKSACPDKLKANRGRYRAAKMNRAVSWANKDLIEKIYRQARKLSENSGKVYHVDHIIPLRGKLVSGLHVETNLQIILEKDNRSKSNKFKT